MSDAEWSLHHSGAFDRDFERLRHKADWSALDRCVLLLTGATGFFGLWLIELFDWLRRDKGFYIKLYILTRNRESVLERHPVYGQRAWIQFIEGDIRSFSLPPEELTT